MKQELLKAGDSKGTLSEANTMSILNAWTNLSDFDKVANTYEAQTSEAREPTGRWQKSKFAAPGETAVRRQFVSHRQASANVEVN